MSILAYIRIGVDGALINVTALCAMYTVELALRLFLSHPSMVLLSPKSLNVVGQSIKNVAVVKIIITTIIIVKKNEIKFKDSLWIGIEPPERALNFENHCVNLGDSQTIDKDQMTVFILETHNTSG